MKLMINGGILDLVDTQIMGILNVSPDSFFDGGKYCVLSKAIDHVAYMIKYGATFIDVGGESTRPGSSTISSEEEAERVIPVIYAISQRFDTLISINTSSELVIREGSRSGAHLINDVRSLNVAGAIQAAVDCMLSVCLVHIQGTPKNMQCNPQYVDIIKEVNDYFSQQIIRCESSGICKNKLLLDPGFGFGKNLKHNYQLLVNLKSFHHFGLPILVGFSRKSMLSCNNRYNPQQRLIGSITCAVIAAMQCIQIIRVHDVKETSEALQILKIMSKYNDRTS